ncbi:MAG TPA: branched-chain amino acid ABC transporter permease [Anaerolineales bacterium]|nr:branched-chain amino acid ABC transporter permease [Anaerolineales bacterium]
MSKKLAVPLLVLALFVIIVGGSWLRIFNEYWQVVFFYIGINIIMAVSLNLINGYMGEFSCGHAAFMAVGAYVSGILTVWWFAEDKVFGPPVLPASLGILLVPVAILIGGLAASFVGLLIAIPSFRTRGDYLAIITLAVNYIVKSAIENMEIIGGPRGFLGMQRVMNAITAVLDIPWLLIWTFIGGIGTIILIQRFVSSTFGKGVMAIREDEVAAGLMGVNTRWVKLIAFMVSCGLAGVAGGLFAHGPGGYINPGMFTILKSTEAMVMVYLGGMGSISGNVLSAVFFTLLLEMLRPLGVYKWVVIPLLLVLMMLFRPSGLMGSRELGDVFPQLRAWFGKEEEYAPASN